MAVTQLNPAARPCVMTAASMRAVVTIRGFIGSPLDLGLGVVPRFWLVGLTRTGVLLLALPSPVAFSLPVFPFWFGGSCENDLRLNHHHQGEDC